MVSGENGVLRAEFSIEDCHYAAYVNLEDKQAEFMLAEGQYYESTAGFVTAKEKYQLSPYMSRCFLKIKGSDYELAGSTGHLFPASEIEAFKVENGDIKLQIDARFVNKGEIFIRIPVGKDGCKVNGEYIKAEKIENLNLVRISIA